MPISKFVGLPPKPKPGPVETPYKNEGIFATGQGPLHFDMVRGFYRGPKELGAPPQPQADEVKHEDNALDAETLDEGTASEGATVESRADIPPFMADEDGGGESWDDIWRDQVPPNVADMGEWEEGGDVRMPPISVNEAEEVGEGWDDDVPHMGMTTGVDGTYYRYPTVAEFMAFIPKEEQMDPVASVYFCTSNEVAEVADRQFGGDVIVDDFERYLVGNHLPMAEECSFYLDSEDDCDAMIEALLPVATALEYEGTDVHIAILEDGKFNFLKNGTFERWSNPEPAQTPNGSP